MLRSGSANLNSAIGGNAGHENFPFAALHNLKITGVPVLAFRISYVDEQGWELHVQYEDGPALWDARVKAARWR